MLIDRYICLEGLVILYFHRFEYFEIEAMKDIKYFLLFLLGRSNVGKSSLLNALTRQWGVVRTSDKPGLTQVRYFS